MHLNNIRYVIADIRKIAANLENQGLAVRRLRILPTESSNQDRNLKNEIDFIDAKRTVLELGHPTSSSILISVVTEEPGLIEDGCVTVIGKTLSELPTGRHSLALILLAEAAVADENSRRVLNRTILACNSFNGIMARMSYGRIWLRFSREALTESLTLEKISRHIIKQIKSEDHRIWKAEIMLVVGDKNLVEKMRPVAEEQARERSERYSASLADKMACETGLDCSDCPETETCNVLKKAVAVARTRNL